jgi:dethiobiotin synthetase
MKTQNSKLKTQNYFITGTDTGVGKTLVTALLVLHFQAHNVDAGVMKPFATGCRVDGEKLHADDTEFLLDVTGISDSPELVTPARWIEPLAPLVAARRAQDDADHWVRCLDAHKVLCARHEIVLCEGVGGALVPIQERDSNPLTCIDWAQALQLPVLLVARRTLGTINHTLLTVEALRAAKLEIAGIVFCDSAPVDAEDVAAQTSPALIEEMSELPILGSVPHLDDLSRASIQSGAREHFSV